MNRCSANLHVWRATGVRVRRGLRPLHTRSSRLRVPEASLPPVVVLECDGVVVDLHTNGHRVAFNTTFEDLGLECANWSPAVYHDLIQYGDGTEEGLVRLFFNKVSVGMETRVATSDQPALSRKIVEMKKDILRKRLREGDVPLRSGVMTFIDEVLEHKASVAVLTETQSDKADGVWEALKPLIGDERNARIQSIAWPETVNEEDGLDGVVHEEVQQMKREGVELFVSTMNAMRREEQVGMEMDPTFFRKRTPGPDSTFFLTMAAALGSSVRQCILVGAHNYILQSASASGVVSVAVPAGLASRQSFPGAEARFDGFGAGGGLSWSHLESLINQRRPH